MGLDGGTIVSRSDVLRGQSWRVAQGDNSRSTRGGNVTRVPAEAAEKNVERSTAWSTCALSSQPLRPPIVSCGLGRLYNKDTALQFLLCKKGRVTVPEALLQYANQLRVAAGGLDHITSMKDLVNVHLHPAEPADAAAGGGSGGSAAASSSNNGGGAAPAESCPFVCPITMLPCDRHPCSALRPCGHVLSDRALRNLGGDASCPVCGAAFKCTLPILGTSEQVDQLREQLRAAAASASGEGATGAATTTGKKAAKEGGGRKRKAAEAPDGEPQPAARGGEAAAGSSEEEASGPTNEGAAHDPKREEEKAR